MSSLDLPVYTILADRHSLERYELAEYPGWQSSTWEFTRLMKGHPALAQLTADEAYEEIDWGLVDFDEDEQLAFLTEWDKVRYIPGWSPLDWALMMADEKQLEPSRSARGRFQKFARFISLAGWLQVERGDENIYLPCRRVGELLGYDPKTISNMRRLAIREKLLSVAKEHSFGKREATEFRFDVSRFEILQERMSKRVEA